MKEKIEHVHRKIDRVAKLRMHMILTSVEGRRKITQEVDQSVPKKQNVKKYKSVLEQVSLCRIREGKILDDNKMEELMNTLLNIRRKN